MEFRHNSNNQLGIIHIWALLIVIIITAVIGTYLIVSSHANYVKPVRKATTFAIRQFGGQEVSDFLGLSSGDRTYIFQIQETGSFKNDRTTRALGIKLTDKPITNVKIKMSSKNRDKSHGCGHNGFLGHRYRDSVKTTDSNGSAVFGNCTNDSFKVLLRNVPGHLRQGNKRTKQINLNDRSVVQLAKYNDGGGLDLVYVIITLN